MIQLDEILTIHSTARNRSAMQAGTRTARTTKPAARDRLTGTAFALALAASLAAGCAVPADTAAPVGEHGAEGVGYGNPDPAAHVALIDEIMMAPVREGQIAGGSVAVVHRGQTVAIRGYGWGTLSCARRPPRTPSTR